MRRTKITLTPQLEHSIHNAKAVAGDVTPFSRFIVRLIELGLAQLDAAPAADLVEQPQTTAIVPDKQASEPDIDDEMADEYAAYLDTTRK